LPVGRVEYPTAFPGMPRLTLGKANLAEHNRRAFHSIDRRELHDPEIRPLADPGFALAEFEFDHSFGGGAWPSAQPRSAPSPAAKHDTIGKAPG
jgi:hypothetical protein